MRPSKSLLAAVSFSLFAGCLGDFFNLAPPYSDVELPPSRFAQCALPEPERVDFRLLAEAEFQHQPAPGLTVDEELPVSAKGCIRYFQRIRDGRLVEQGLVMALGLVEVFNEPDGTVAFREHERYLSREVFTETSSRIETDSDADGFIEALMIGTFDEQGLVEQVITFFSPSNGQVDERRTMVRVDGDTIRWIEEKLVDGKLTVTRDQVAPAQMDANLETAGNCYFGEVQNVDCSAAEKERLRSELLKALEKGAACLAKAEQRGPKYGKKDRDLVAHLIKTRANHIYRGCFEGEDPLANVRPVNSNPYGEKLIMVNVGMLRCQSSNFIQKVLFHEVLHLTRGPHDANSSVITELRNDGKMTHNEYVYTDSLRACEAYCFEEVKNRCSCAACFQTMTCDPGCEGEASCHQKDASGQYVMSEAVGALCGKGLDGQPRWYGTMAACSSVCSVGCKSYSLSCNLHCN
jgi:hypothetical protein